MIRIVYTANDDKVYIHSQFENEMEFVDRVIKKCYTHSFQGTRTIILNFVSSEVALFVYNSLVNVIKLYLIDIYPETDFDKPITEFRITADNKTSMLRISAKSRK